MAEPPEIRIGTAEREDALARLSRHFSDGRLTVAEFDSRSATVAGATTRGQLDALFTDLPASSPTPPAVAESSSAKRMVESPWTGRIVALTPLIALLLFFVTGSWLWFLAIPAIAIVVYGSDRGRDKPRRGRDRRRHSDHGQDEDR